ncbi:MAG: L,D-transpeptidase family protein [Planctomycetota bacterium]|jgi:LysM repeat protein
MAKYRYTPYRRRKTRRRNIAYFLLAIVVIIAVVVTARKLHTPEQAIGRVPADDVEVIDFTPKPDPAPEPEPAGIDLIPEPEPEPELAPEPEPKVQPETADPVIEPVIDSGDLNNEAVKLITEAGADIKNGKIIAARDKLNYVRLSMPLSSKQRQAVKATLAKLSNRWLFSRDPYAGDTLTGTYVVQSGDLLSEIAKQYKVPYEILMTINNIRRPENLRAGETIKVVNGPFHAIVYRSTFMLDLYLGTETYVKSFKVGLGEEGLETPTGKWRVKAGGKLIKPTWTNPQTGRRFIADDPDYPLGSRWIALEGLTDNAKGRTGFAIHGTKEPETIGTRSSMGCIRLLNGEAIEIYNMLVPRLSEVRVVD